MATAKNGDNWRGGSFAPRAPKSPTRHGPAVSTPTSARIFFQCCQVERTTPQTSCQRAQPRASSQYRLKERLVGSKAPSCGDQRTSNLSTPRPLHGCCELQPSHPYPIQSRGQRARDEGDWRGHGSGRDVSPPILLTPRPVAFSDGLVACKHVLLLSLTVIVSCFFTLMMALLAFSFPLFIIMWSDCSLLNLLCAPVNGAKILY